MKFSTNCLVSLAIWEVYFILNGKIEIELVRAVFYQSTVRGPIVDRQISLIDLRGKFFA